MIAEILSTGDEILSGALIDSNAAFIARKLEEKGILVARHSCIGDDLESLAAMLKEIGERSDIAVVTGGLGPTNDDLNAEAAALAKGVELHMDEQILNEIKGLFSARKFRMSRSNAKQAMFPKGAEVLKNPVGTAPGFSISIGKCIFFFLPGVPYEMEHMMEEKVLPEIDGLRAGKETHMLTRAISIFGLPESETGERLEEIAGRFPEIEIGFRARFPDIEVKLKARGEDENFIKKQLDEASAWAADKIGIAAYSLGGESMEEVVGRRLSERNATVALAESCTGGLIAHRLTNVSGSSDYFLFSAVTYSNEAKMRVLGVRKETLKTFGAVSEQTAGEMSEGARKISGAVFSLSTTGIAGPTGGSLSKPVGTVCIGLSSSEGTFTSRYVFSSVDRIRNKEIFAVTAMDLLRRKLEGLPPGKRNEA